MNDQGWYGFDLDGTLANYTGWIPDGSIGEPVPRTVALAQRLHAEGFEIRIFTARVSQGARETPEDVERMRERVGKWAEQHLGFHCVVTNVKDHRMIALFDDRCVQVEPNTGRLLGDPTLVKGLPKQVLDL